MWSVLWVIEPDRKNIRATPIANCKYFKRWLFATRNPDFVGETQTCKYCVDCHMKQNDTQSDTLTKDGSITTVVMTLTKPFSFFMNLQSAAFQTLSSRFWIISIKKSGYGYMTDSRIQLFLSSCLWLLTFKKILYDLKQFLVRPSLIAHIKLHKHRTINSSFEPCNFIACGDGF